MARDSYIDRNKERKEWSEISRWIERQRERERGGGGGADRQTKYETKNERGGRKKELLKRDCVWATAYIIVYITVT